jgi:hypothetical protein
MRFLGKSSEREERSSIKVGRSGCETNVNVLEPIQKPPSGWRRSDYGDEIIECLL